MPITDHSSSLRTPELHISIFIKQQQQARWAHPRPGRSERSTGPLSEREREREREGGRVYSYSDAERRAGALSKREREREREGARAYSQTAADEREAILNLSHKVYIDRSLSNADTMGNKGSKIDD